MANPNTPFGLQPVQRLDGAALSARARLYFVPAANTNALFVGDPVIKTHASADTNGIPGCDLATAGTGNQITGVVVGFYGTCTAGTGQYGNFFGLSGTPGPANRPATTSLDFYVLVNDDPEAQFIVQCNDAGGVPAATALVGLNANLASAAGSAFTGLSGWQLTPTGAATTNTLQLRVIEALKEADNTPGSANAKYVVQINQHTELPHQAGI